MISPPPLGWRGLAYIAPSNECGPSDQTDLNAQLVLKIRGGGARSARPVLIGHQSMAGALPPGPISLPFVAVASGLY